MLVLVTVMLVRRGSRLTIPVLSSTWPQLSTSMTAVFSGGTRCSAPSLGGYEVTRSDKTGMSGDTLARLPYLRSSYNFEEIDN